MKKFTEMPFIPVLLGANLNSYSLAREFHEAYNIKSIVLGKFVVTQIIGSKILDFIQIDEMEDENVLVPKINEIADKYNGTKIILLGCSDTMLKIIMQNKSEFAKNIIAPYVDIKKAEQLMNKEEFYKICEAKNIAYPKTFIINKENAENFVLENKVNLSEYPLVLKPSDQPAFFAHKFIGQKKVYIVNNKEDLNAEIKNIYNSGYTGSLVLQEYIKGADSNMYVLNAYVNQKGKVSFMSFANILLEEHTPTARGNHAVIINDYNKEVCEIAKKFLEEVDYTGFANFDIKYDAKDNTYKFFEINLRQGNSHYHVTAAGYNMAKILVDDIIYGKEAELLLARNKKVFSIIPLFLGFIYIKDKSKLKLLLKMIIKRQAVNPLFYRKDFSFKRYYYLYLNLYGHILKFLKYYMEQK